MGGCDQSCEEAGYWCVWRRSVQVTGNESMRPKTLLEHLTPKPAVAVVVPNLRREDRGQLLLWQDLIDLNFNHTHFMCRQFINF